MKKKIFKHIYQHIKLINENQKDIFDCVEKIAKDIKETLNNKKTIFLLVTEVVQQTVNILQVNWLEDIKNRKPYKAISLTTDTSVLTCIANDFGYEKIFERQLEGLGQKGDLLIVFSTSGQSKNIVNFLKKSKKMRIKSIALLGKTGGQCKKISSYSYVVPSSSTANIQEIHHLIGHIFCSLVD